MKVRTLQRSSHRLRIVGIMLTVALLLSTAAFAGDKLPTGSYVAQGPSAGSFTISNGGNSLTWTDGLQYTFIEVPSNPEGYYFHDDPPPYKWVNFQGNPPDKTSGTYQAGGGLGPFHR